MNYIAPTLNQFIWHWFQWEKKWEKWISLPLSRSIFALNRYIHTRYMIWDSSPFSVLFTYTHLALYLLCRWASCMYRFQGCCHSLLLIHAHTLVHSQWLTRMYIHTSNIHIHWKRRKKYTATTQWGHWIWNLMDRFSRNFFFFSSFHLSFYLSVSRFVSSRFLSFFLWLYIFSI